MSITLRAKQPSFRLFISPHASCLSPHDGLCLFCARTWATYFFHCRLKSKPEWKSLDFLVNVPFRSAPEIVTTSLTEPALFFDCLGEKLLSPGHLPIRCPLIRCGSR